MKMKVPLRELSNLDVNWVSLVDRGANRIPFRIVKRDPNKESPMLNLSNAFGRVKKAEQPKETTVSAVVLAKGDQSVIDAARAVLVEQGMDLPETKIFE